MPVKKAIVSLATDRGNYYQGLARLADSLKGKFDGDFFGFMGEHAVAAPKHLENPYAFKVYAIEHVRQLGYEQIVWLDSSVVARQNVKPVFDELDRVGYIMQEAGQFVGSWCNEQTLQYFGLERKDAMNMLCYGNAGFLGLNFSDDLCLTFFRQWKNAMQCGMFRGSWDDHRHDLTCGSIIASRLGMIYKSGNEWLDYSPPEQPLKNDTIIFTAQGL